MEVLSAVESSSQLVNIFLTRNPYSTGQTGENDLILVILPCNIILVDLQTMKILSILKSANSLENLTKIHISHSHITDEAAEDLAVVLSRNNKLEELVLSHNDMHTENSVVLFRGMKNLCNLTLVDISHNNIGQEAACYLSDLLSQNTKLLHLDLSNNDFQVLGFCEILKGLKNVTALNFSNNNITNISTDVADYLSHYSTLEELDLSYNSIKATDAIEIFKGVKSIATLKRLNISHNNITDVAAEDIAVVLSQLDKLKEIDLSWNNFKAPGTVKLLKATDIVSMKQFNIDVSYEALDETVSILSRKNEVDDNNSNSGNKIKIFQATSNSAILVVKSQRTHTEAFIVSSDLASDLRYQRIEGLEFLRINNITNLTKIRICYSNFTTDYLAIVLFYNIQLEELVLCHNKITVLKTYSNFNILLHLMHIDISFNEIDLGKTHGLFAVLSHCPNLKDLNFSFNKLPAKDVIYILKELKNVPTLKKLNMRDIFSIPDAAVEAIVTVLSNNSFLEELYLNCSSLRNYSARTVLDVIGNSTLQMVDIVLNSTIAYNLTNVLTLSSLKDIRISFFFSFMLLRENPNPNQLNFPSHEDHHSVDAMSYSYSEINIPFHGNSASSFTSLQLALEIYSTAKESQSRLAYLTISQTYLRKVPFALHKQIVTDNMMTVDILGKCIGDHRRTKRLKKLYIIGVNITDKDADSLANILSCNSDIEEFVLCLSDIKYATTVFTGMKNMSHLTYFNISSCGITSEAEDSICDVLLSNQKLRELDLSYNYLPASIFLKLQSITNLVKLNIRCMHITDKGADDLATLLSHNSKLREFDASHNWLQSEGVIKIFKGIQNIFSFIKLDISYNMITDEAADNIAVVLSQCNDLKYLYLVKVNMHLKGIEKIAKSIGHILLDVFDIRNNGIESTKAATITSLLNINTNVKY